MNEIQGEILEFLKTQGYLNEKIHLEEKDSLTKKGVIDSIIMLELVDFLEIKFGIDIPVEMLTSEKFDTMEQISQSVMKLKKRL